MTKINLDIFKKMKNSHNNEKLLKPKKGDILCLNMYQLGIHYEHYGVYSGNSKVIHYSSQFSDSDSELQIVETSFKDFLKKNNEFFILDFSLLNPVKSDPIPIYIQSDIFCPNCAEFLKNLMEFREMLEKSAMTLYSPKETVKRARSRLGEKKYNLLLNNCEHFAIWCKTGLSKSYQIEKLLKVVLPFET